MTKNLLKALFAVMILWAGNAQSEVDAAKAETFIKNVTAEGIEDIINANVPQAEKDKRFAKLFNEALDLDFIGQFVARF